MQTVFTHLKQNKWESASEELAQYAFLHPAIWPMSFASYEMKIELCRLMNLDISSDSTIRITHL